jgi:hypothetical protein
MTPPGLATRLFLPILCACLLCISGEPALGQSGADTSAATPPESPGIQVPPGFRVELYADDDLAHDIHSMTIDSTGRVVVSGPGYVRILIDSNNDGRADSFKQFADKPATGSQGCSFSVRA